MVTALISCRREMWSKWAHDSCPQWGVLHHNVLWVWDMPSLLFCTQTGDSWFLEGGTTSDSWPFYDKILAVSNFREENFCCKTVWRRHLPTWKVNQIKDLMPVLLHFWVTTLRHHQKQTWSSSQELRSVASVLTEHWQAGAVTAVLLGSNEGLVCVPPPGNPGKHQTTISCRVTTFMSSAAFLVRRWWFCIF